jgi:hypothetical protein
MMSFVEGKRSDILRDSLSQTIDLPWSAEINRATVLISLSTQLESTFLPAPHIPTHTHENDARCAGLIARKRGFRE